MNTQGMGRRLSVAGILSVLVLGGIPTSSKGLPSEWMDQNTGKAVRLRTEIVTRYESLRLSGNLAVNRPGNHIEDIVLQYIPLGSSFDEAELILRQVGFKVYARPSIEVPGNRFDRFNVDAVAEDLLSPPAMFMSAKVVVSLQPPKPGDYSRVVAMYASISVVAL